MRVCSTFYGFYDLGCGIQRPQTHRVARELVDAALLAVDHAHRRTADETRLAQGLDRRDQGSAGGDDVLDDAPLLALLEHALDALGGPVALRLLADEQEREARRERPRRRERDGPELWAGEASRLGR